MDPDSLSLSTIGTQAQKLYPTGSFSHNDASGTVGQSAKMKLEKAMPLSVLKDIRKIYAGLNPDEIRKLAWQDINVGLIASSEEAYRAMERFLAPPAIDPWVQTQAARAVHRVDGPLSKYDFILCEPGTPLAANGFAFAPGQPGLLISGVLAENEQLELALARTFPAFRSPATHRLINRVSRENALFSLVTALPNVVPSLLELPWTVGEFATDTAFLTMNQIRMALSIAAGHGRAVGYSEQKAEIAAIAAGAFGWRAIARELIGKIPLGGGLIPKAAVAFAGTYVVGLGLEKLHSTGLHMSRQEKRDAYADAFAKGKDVARDLAPTIRDVRGNPVT